MSSVAEQGELVMFLPLRAQMNEIYPAFYVSAFIQRRNPLPQIPIVLHKTRSTNPEKGRWRTALTSNITETKRNQHQVGPFVSGIYRKFGTSRWLILEHVCRNDSDDETRLSLKMRLLTDRKVCFQWEMYRFTVTFL
jgi:hypothetical protein